MSAHLNGYGQHMHNALAEILDPAARAARATVDAVVGRLDQLSPETVDTFGAVLTIDSGASTPKGVALLRPGATHRAIVQAGPNRAGQQLRRLNLKLPDAHGPGEDQDFLLASSADGVPMHHAVLPSDPVAALYSSLWLYLVGLQPLLFGARPPVTGPDVRFGVGDELAFMVSPAVGRFRRIGSLTLTEPVDEPVAFAGSRSGGNIRPLPPVNCY